MANVISVYDRTQQGKMLETVDGNTLPKFVNSGHIAPVLGMGTDWKKNNPSRWLNAILCLALTVGPTAGFYFMFCLGVRFVIIFSIIPCAFIILGKPKTANGGFQLKKAAA